MNIILSIAFLTIAGSMLWSSGAEVIMLWLLALAALCAEIADCLAKAASEETENPDENPKEWWL